MSNKNEGSAAGKSNAAPPPPPPPPPPRSSGTKRPSTPSKTAICPVCKRNMYHDKALNGHIRWHTAEEREAAGVGTARALANAIVVEEPEVTKRAKLPDLNRSPPPEDGDQA
ncbi:hypothetical protein L1987_84064 [Smallanthus sonchifolius]|uniref:Uncharacterized protein n=1 Tax=Smallanthus sonchifolius TaxID=185202 RepID=A0ACB8YES9_9ASTR|nr:hypothetical protein L1987_84064 [Smallanthus sonchifolius]